MQTPDEYRSSDTETVRVEPTPVLDDETDDPGSPTSDRSARRSPDIKRESPTLEESSIKREMERDEESDFWVETKIDRVRLEVQSRVLLCDST